MDGQGNFGSVDRDSAAAYRYTEARLKQVAMELLEYIDKETVDFIPNFDGRIDEPTVLPGKVPNLLINGSAGIAVGMATNIPPHNIGEIIDGLKALIGSPNYAGKQWVYEQYDQQVMGDTARTPGAGSGIVRVHGTDKLLSLTSDVTPRYVKANPVEGGRQAVAEAWRNRRDDILQTSDTVVERLQSTLNGWESNTAIDGATFATNYIVPYTQQVHDRIGLEVLRGYTQGCRFCQAGMIYRPVRERRPESILASISDSFLAPNAIFFTITEYPDMEVATFLFFTFRFLSRLVIADDTSSISFIDPSTIASGGSPI